MDEPVLAEKFSLTVTIIGEKIVLRCDLSEIKNAARMCRIDWIK